MRRSHPFVFSLVCLAVCVVSSSAFSGQVVSSMKNVRAVMQDKGYYLAPAPDLSGQTPFGDHAPVQAFELIRPRGEQIKIGRLYTSCTCVRLVAEKTAFARGERAIFYLHNVLPTPVTGQNYAFYIQVTSPIRTTLRYDTFVQSAIYAPVAGAQLVVGNVDGTDTSGIEIIEPAVARKEEPKEELAKEEPAESPAAEAAEEGKGERKTVELKVAEVAEAEKEVEPADDADVDEYVNRFLEKQADETAEEAGAAVSEAKEALSETE